MSRLLPLLLALGCQLTLLAAEPAPTVASIAGIQLRLPAGLSRVDEPPPGALAGWRSADGLVAIVVVQRAAVEAEPLAEQLAALQALGQDVVVDHSDASTPPWYRLRYRIRLGPTRFVQAVRLATLTGPGASRQLLVTASWPEALGPRWDAALTAALDTLAID